MPQEMSSGHRQRKILPRDLEVSKRKVERLVTKTQRRLEKKKHGGKASEKFSVQLLCPESTVVRKKGLAIGAGLHRQGGEAARQMKEKRVCRGSIPHIAGVKWANRPYSFPRRAKHQDKGITIICVCVCVE